MKPFFESAGEVATLDVLAALCAVGRGGASGEARFTGADGETVRYGFEHGVLVAVETPPDNAPAETLIRAGKIQRATYEALTVGDFEDRFAVAVASGVISRREAGWGIKIAAIETLARIAASGAGTYTFAEGPAEPMEPPFRLPVDHWILELFLRSGDRSFVLRKIGATDIPIARVDGFAEGFAALGLTADADAVVAGIDGQRTIEKVVKHSRADEFATLKLLAALMTLGLIHPILEAPRAPVSPARDPEPPASDESAPEEPAPPEPPLDPFPEAEELRPEEDSATVALPIPIPGNAEEEAWDDRDRGEDATVAFSGVPEEGEPIELPPPPASSAPIRDDAPVINLPLFALTAPEEPATETMPERDDTAAAESSAAARGARGWLIAAFAAAFVVAAIFLVRRPRLASPPARPPAVAPEAPGSPREKPAATVPPKEAPRTAPSEIVVSRVPAARTAPPSGSRNGPAEKPSGGSRWAALAEVGRREFEHPGRNRYSIQLELACEDSTLEKAFAADPGRRRIWLAPYSFRGKRCYRVLWGKFADLGAARAAKSAVPALFARDGNRPTVVSLAKPTGVAKGKP